MLHLTCTVRAFGGVGKNIRCLKPSVSEGLVCSNFPALIQPVFEPFRRYKQIHQSKKQAEMISKVGIRGVWSPSYADREQAFFGDTGLGHITTQSPHSTSAHKGRQAAKNAWWAIQECPVLHISPCWSLALPAYSIDSPGSEQPNAPTPSWWDLKRAIRKSWIFWEEKNWILHGPPCLAIPTLAPHHACMQRAQNHVRIRDLKCLPFFQSRVWGS